MIETKPSHTSRSNFRLHRSLLKWNTYCLFIDIRIIPAQFNVLLTVYHAVILGK